MSSEAELLPCPFCGSATHPEVKAWDDTDGVDGFMVLCSALGFAGQRARGCGAASPWSATPAEAITAWNRRSASPSIGRVGVKALEWRNVDSPDMASGDWWFEAYSPFGNYTITFVERHTLPWLLEPFFSDLDSNYASEDQAKAAAQQDYESRIRSALVYQAVTR